MSKKLDAKKFLKKIEQLKKEHQLDLSSDEDLSIAIMNLVSLEEHFFFTGAKTNKDKYFDLQEKVREIRKSLLKRIVKDTEGETWCISKHLLAASMRLIEVGTKYQHQGEKKEAKEMFAQAYDLYSLFWGINLRLVDIGKVKKIDDGKLNIHDKDKSVAKTAAIGEAAKNKDGVMDDLNDLVQKLIDCCDE